MNRKDSFPILKKLLLLTAAAAMISAILISCDLFSGGLDSSFVENRTWRQVGDIVSDLNDWDQAGDFQPELAFGPDGTPYVVYMDGSVTDSSARPLLTVKKFNGTEWVAVGTKGFAPAEKGFSDTTHDVSMIDITVAQDGTVYVAYPDTADVDNDVVAATGDLETEPTGSDPIGDSEISVMKYNTVTEAWELVGSQAFSEVAVNSVSITTYNNTPIVSYTEGTTNESGDTILSEGSNYLFVKKFDGSNWVAIGDSSNTLNINDIYDAVGNRYQFDPVAADKDGNLFTVFADSHNDSTPLTLKMFNSSTGSWITSDYATSSAITKQSIAVDNNGNAFVAYLLTNQGGGPVYAQKFNGSSNTWEKMGDSFEEDAYNPSIAVDKKGIVYVAYGDGDDRVSVKEYYGGSWSFAGSNADSSISTDQVFYLSIAVNPYTDTPYLLIKDDGVNSGALVVYKLVE